jgi:DNA-binding NarL/FixJ family response regulator
MGENLFIGKQTVKKHMNNIFDTLGISGRFEVALYGIHHRLVDQA